jgi:hypothetical protein
MLSRTRPLCLIRMSSQRWVYDFGKIVVRIDFLLTRAMCGNLSQVATFVPGTSSDSKTTGQVTGSHVTLGLWRGGCLPLLEELLKIPYDQYDIEGEEDQSLLK